MMMAENEQKSWTRRYGGIAAFAFGGGVGGYFIGKMIAGSFLPGEAPPLDISMVVATTIGAIYLLLGAIVGLGAAIPAWGIKQFNEGDADDYYRQRPQLVASTIAMLLSGLALVLLALYEPLGIAPMTAAIAFFALLILGTAIFLRYRHTLDELDWRMSDEGTVYSFYAVVIIGGSWAALAHLGLTQGPAMLDWLSMFWGFVLLASFVSVGRRGMMG